MATFNGRAENIEDNRNKTDNVAEGGSTKYPTCKAVIDYTEKSIVDSVNYVNNNFANALKGEKSGTAISITDTSPMEHDVDVKVRKNLIPYTYKGLNETNNGITFVDNGDGTIIANGTNTNETTNGNSYGSAFVKINVNLTLPKGTYILKNIGVPKSQCLLRYIFSDQIAGRDVFNKDLTFVLTNKTTLRYFNVMVRSGMTVDNFVFKPQLYRVNVATEDIPDIEDFSSVILGVSGINLYDDTTKEVGKCFGLSNFPEITERATTNLSDYIKVLPNTTLTLNYGLMWAFYDKYKNYISENSSGTESATIKRKITVPNNAYYVRFAYHNQTEDSSVNYSDGSDVMAVLGVDLPTEYQPFTKPLESYSVNADGSVGGESTVTYTESDGSDFVTVSGLNDLILDTSKIPEDATKLHIVAEFYDVGTHEHTIHLEFDFTKGVSPSDGIYGILYYVDTPSNIIEITESFVTVSADNGFPEKLYAYYDAVQVISYTAEITIGEEVIVKSIYPSMSLLTDTNDVLINAEYNRDINKAFAELQAAIINLGGNLNV